MTTTPDIPLIRKVWDMVLEQHNTGSRWNQSAWRTLLDGELYSRLRRKGKASPAELAQRCGTAMCVAGWAVELSPGRAQWASDDPGDDEFDEVFLNGHPHPVLAGTAACDLLGVDYSLARSLFDSENDINDVHRLLSQAAGEELTPLPPQRQGPHD